MAAYSAGTWCPRPFWLRGQYAHVMLEIDGALVPQYLQVYRDFSPPSSFILIRCLFFSDSVVYCRKITEVEL